MTNITETFTEETVQQLAAAALTLKDVVDPETVIDLLYDLQGELIKGEYLDLVNEQSKSGIAFKFLVLKDFLRAIAKIELTRKEKVN